jgi:FtsP/CotA-like multicopper oxidase with cupredoxin domain
MSFQNPAHLIPRRSIAGQEGHWVKIFDPPQESPPTPELLAPTNPVPGQMLNAGYQDRVTTPNTVQRDLLHGLRLTMFDGTRVEMFVFSDRDNPSTQNGNYPGATIRVPRGVIFHCQTQTSGGPHTIHWHGLEPTPINDGVGHCSMELGQYIYQFQPNFIGTYFYHCHRNTVQHFEFGLHGLIIVEPPDRSKRIAANTANFPQFPGFNSNPITSDPLGYTLPYDVEAFWVLQAVDSVWHDIAADHFAFFPAHGTQPGVNDTFYRGFFHDYNPDYFFVTGVPVPVAAPGPGTIASNVVIPPALNSGVAGTQVSINAQINQTILVRCLDAAYGKARVTFPVDVVIIAWDGRSLGVPPYAQYNSAYLVKAGTPIKLSVARRFGALIRSAVPVNSFATVEFRKHEGDRLLMTARIPFVIT